MDKSIVMDKSIQVGFAILKLSKLHMYETYYDEIQPYFGQENIQLHFLDTDGIVISMHTKDIIKHLKDLEDFFDLSVLNENHELFRKKKRKSCSHLQIRIT